MKGLSYVEVAFKVIRKFVDENDIPSNDLRNLLTKSFSTFRSSG